MNICKRELMSPELMLTTVEENSFFQSTYKESTRCKTSKRHVHGYLAKYPTRRQLMDAQIEEQAHVASEAQRKNIELEVKV
jgi:tRNA-dihydrouridine synthase